MKNLLCNDVDGTILKVGDMVVVLDVQDLENTPPQRGQRLMVTNCIDAESNYIEFIDLLSSDMSPKYSFYGHRVLKLI